MFQKVSAHYCFLCLQITICHAVGKSWIIIVTKLCYILIHGKTCGEYIYFLPQWCQSFISRMWTQSHEPTSIHAITNMFQQKIFSMFWCKRTLYSEALLTHWKDMFWLCLLDQILNHFLYSLLYLLCNAITPFLSCILSYHIIDQETFPPLQLTLTLGTTSLALFSSA